MPELFVRRESGGRQRWEHLDLYRRGNFMDRKTRTFKYFTAGHPNSVLQNNLKCIAYDEKRNRLYIGTHRGGLSRYDIKTGIFITT